MVKAVQMEAKGILKTNLIIDTQQHSVCMDDKQHAIVYG